MDNNTIDKLVAESLANRLRESELNCAHLEARYTLALAELYTLRRCWNMIQLSKNYLTKRKQK